MTRTAQDYALAAQLGLHRVKFIRELCLGKDGVEHDEVGIVGRDILRMSGALRRKLRENTLNLRLFLCRKLAQLVICLDRRHGLNEKSCTRGRYIVHETLDSALTLGFYGHDKAVGSHGDYGLLQHLRIRRRGYYFLQTFAHARTRSAYFAADIGKLRGGAVCDLVLAHNGAADLFFKKSVCVQRGKKMVNTRFTYLVVGNVALNESCALKHARDIQKLRRVKAAAEIRAAERRANILYPRQRRASAHDHHFLGSARFAKACLDFKLIPARAQRKTSLLAALGHGFRREHFENNRKLKRIE